MSLHKLRRALWSWGRQLLWAMGIALALTTLLITPVRVLGDSMETTLHSGEVMLVTRPEALLGSFSRGDVVICKYPNRFSTLTLPIGSAADVGIRYSQLFVKRLVALPGDGVEVRAGVLYVNDRAVEGSFIAYPARRDYPRTVMGADQYMVMGDNRAGSHDSRSLDVGPISRDMIVGRPRLVILPLRQMRVIQ